MPSTNKCVVVWERKSGNRLILWQPYSAELSEVIERSYTKKLTCVYLGDIDCHYSAQFIYFNCLEQRKQDSVRGVSVRRSIYPSDSCPGQGIFWQWYDFHSKKWHFYIFDIQDYIEESYQKGDGGIDLSKFIVPLPYIIDFAHMMQRRKVTGTRRSVRRLEGRPYPLVQQGSDASEPSTDTSSATAGIVTRSALRNVQQASNSSSPSAASTSAATAVVHRIARSLQKSDSSAGRLEHASEAESAQLPSSGASSKFLKWLTTPLFRSGSSPEGLSATEEVTTTKKTQSMEQRPQTSKHSKSNGVSSLIRRNTKKRPTHKSRYVVDSDPPERADFLSVDDFLTKHCEIVSESPSENCSICYETLSSTSSYDSDDATVLKLSRCGHHFHRPCVKAMLSVQSPPCHLQCPTCKVICGVKIGNQPPGRMEYFIFARPLPSYEDYDTICIVYNFKGGIQGSEHPCPNQPYSATTFPRTCYLPDNEKGRMVLRLLMVAWQRRLTFTIGSSVTTGETNVVTWNEIHHKTEFGSNHSGHGYPDPNYFDNVLLELAAQGVVAEDIDEANE